MHVAQRFTNISKIQLLCLDERSSQSGAEEDDGDEDNSESSKETETGDSGQGDSVPEMMKMTKQRTKTRTISRSVYTDREGNPISEDVMQDINQFQVRVNSCLVSL